uniref:Asp_protease domain-containing protein n=1 Tax=Mesocestoides corti TaxID=53468 RepID=A0A5K3EH68_MESCO
MKLTFALHDGRIFSLDAPSDTLMTNIRLMVAIEAGVPDKNVILMKNEQALTIHPLNTVQDCGLGENDLIWVQINNLQPPHSESPLSNIGSLLPGSSNAGQFSSSIHNDFSIPDLAEAARQHFLRASEAQRHLLRQRNKPLYDALNDQAAFRRIFDAQRNASRQAAIELELSDPLNPAAQKRIAELIQQKNIDNEMEAAMEYYPETFGQVTMLYVACEVNGFPIKAFVDSGAQTTLMSLQCARNCNLEHLIDKRWSGMAYGIGTQKIIGRIHQAQLKLNGTAIPSSFVVLEDQQMDLMIGLDMLKRHKCCINLAENVLTVGEHTSVPFLPEAELPAFAKIPVGASNSELNSFVSEPPDVSASSLCLFISLWFVLGPSMDLYVFCCFSVCRLMQLFG